MMKMRTIGICTLAAILAAGAAATTSAAPPVGGQEEARPLRTFLSGQFGRLLTLRSDLQLSDEQRDEIRQIVKSHKQEIVTAMKPVAETRRALRSASLADQPDERAIHAAANDLGQALGDAAVLGAKIKAEVREVLTPEQRQKVETFRNQADDAVDRFLDEAVERS